MNCPKCKSGKYVKDGRVKGKQRYCCKECKYRYTVEQREKPYTLKRLALQLYLEGLGFRSIERIIQVSYVAVMKWIKAFGEKVEECRKAEGNIDIIEMDELHTYLQPKKNIVGSRLLLIGLGENTLISCLVQGEQKQE
jgi:transposase